MQNAVNSNKWVNWIEESISRQHIKYYDYKHFSNVQEIDNEGFGKVFRVNWKKSEQYLALKSFKISNDATVKELVHELELRREIKFHDNIIRFYGITITDQENQHDKIKEYLLVTEYADSGSLQNYLKKNFNRLTWDDKYKLAYQMACAVSYLHEEGIAHLNLHPKSVLVHQDIIKLADFGLAKRAEEATKKRPKLISNIPYLDPKRLIEKKYELNKKSDIYSVGVLLWEISSGRPPFYNYDIGLIYEISQGAREKPIPDTPEAYIKIYTKCWDMEPDNRPTMSEVVDQLISAKKRQTNIIHGQQQFSPDRIRKYSDSPFGSTNRIITSGVIKRLNKKERKFEDKDVNPLSKIVEEIVNRIVNKDKRGLKEVSDRDILIDYFTSHDVNLQEIHDWLLENQHDPNAIFLLGRLSDLRIRTRSNRSNRQRAHKIYQDAADLMYKVGDAVEERDHSKAFELIRKSAEGTMTNILRNRRNSEVILEIVESCNAVALTTAEVAMQEIHENACQIQ